MKLSATHIQILRVLRMDGLLMTAADIAIATGLPIDEVAPHLDGLDISGCIHAQTMNGLRRHQINADGLKVLFHLEPRAMRAAINLPIAVTPTAPFSQAKPAVQKLLPKANLANALQTLEQRLALRIEQLDTKQETLARLSQLLDPSIGSLLMEIHTDLTRAAGAHA